jgi:predicted O-linked N-acetylglucosamine transferase (SPINDLY family)
VYASDKHPHALAIEPTEPISVVLGAALLADMDERALRFVAGRAMTWARVGLAGPARMTADEFSVFLVALPNLGCWLVPGKDESGEPPALDLAADEVVLLCPGNAFKYGPQHDRLLTAIAQRVPRSRLVFFRSRPEPLAEKLGERLRESFRRAGADFERQVNFLPWQSRASFRALLKRADLYLDTIGFSGFNTAVQALECGLPIVAREGRFLRGRLASGMLRHLGLDELVAPSDEAYVELAATLAADRERRQELRRRIEAGRERLYRDREPLDALQRFIETAVG